LVGDLKPMLVGAWRFLAMTLLTSLVVGCNALAEDPGRDPSTEPRPEIALDCEPVLSGSDIIGLGVEQGSETSVAQRFLARQGLRPDDRLSVEHGPWEPNLAAVRVTRSERTIASVELERADGGWMIRAFSLCDDFDAP
jgi:hypothetical protein